MMVIILIISNIDIIGIDMIITLTTMRMNFQLIQVMEALESIEWVHQGEEADIDSHSERQGIVRLRRKDT